MSGWIKFYRQFLINGHFHMPDRALKIWLYILLSASHKDRPAAGLRAGEAWISYDQIARDCGEAGKQMRRETVARALTWLEEHGYIRRVVVKGRGQKIIVPNWDKYQGGTSSESEPAAELEAELTHDGSSETELAPELTHDGSSETELAPELTHEGSSVSELAAELAGGGTSSESEPAAELKQECKEEHIGEGERRSSSSPVGEEDERPTARGQIAELVMHYRDACRAKPLQRDYAFMGRLYNTYPIDRIYEAIEATALRIAAGHSLKDPLTYIAGVLRRGEVDKPRASPVVRETPIDRKLRELGVV
jgi:hypothetical protein